MAHLPFETCYGTHTTHMEVLKSSGSREIRNGPSAVIARQLILDVTPFVKHSVLASLSIYNQTFIQLL